MKKIVITGSTGYIGSYLCSILKDQGYIIALSRNINENYECDVLIHAAGRTPSTIKKDEGHEAQYRESNIELVKHVSRKVKARLVINLSTTAVYEGVGQKKISETDLTNPCGVYAFSKLKGERILNNEFANILHLRLPVVIGAGMKDNFLTRMTASIHQDNEVRLYNADYPYNNIISLSELGFLICQIIKSNFQGISYLNVCADDEMTLYEIAVQIGKVLGKKVDIHSLGYRDAANYLSNKKIKTQLKLGKIVSVSDCIESYALSFLK